MDKEPLTAAALVEAANHVDALIDSFEINDPVLERLARKWMTAAWANGVTWGIEQAVEILKR